MALQLCKIATKLLLQFKACKIKPNSEILILHLAV